jgi:hypothetical protein
VWPTGAGRAARARERATCERALSSPPRAAAARPEAAWSPRQTRMSAAGVAPAATPPRCFIICSGPARPASAWARAARPPMSASGRRTRAPCLWLVELAIAPIFVLALRSGTTRLRPCAAGPGRASALSRGARRRPNRRTGRPLISSGSSPTYVITARSRPRNTRPRRPSYCTSSSEPDLGRDPARLDRVDQGLIIALVLIAQSPVWAAILPDLTAWTKA